jgi:hypothetical protein
VVVSCTVAFCFLLVVPRATRVALAFAVAAAPFAALSGAGTFVGAISNSLRAFCWLLNILAMLLRICFTLAPSWATTFASAWMASFQPPFAVAVAATALSTDGMNVTA